MMEVESEMRRLGESEKRRLWPHVCIFFFYPFFLVICLICRAYVSLIVFRVLIKSISEGG